MNQQLTENPAYRGRFAPSPTGLLHLGSLTAALGSYLDARANAGEWLLRIEDIDPPREEPGAKETIPKQLEEHGLEWDGPISYQSDRSNFYRECLSKLDHIGATYLCSCSRRRIRELNGVYDRHCLKQPPGADEEAAIRLKIEGSYLWTDHIQGEICFDTKELGGDFIVHRKEDFFSYQLAVAADDHQQGITHVIRGADLLDSTARQGFIMRALGWNQPQYAHLPIITGDDGHKLSKQSHAPVLNSKTVVKNLYQALQLLGLKPATELMDAEKSELIRWAASHWKLSKVPRTMISTKLC